MKHVHCIFDIMDRYILRSNEEFPFQVKTEIKTEIQTDENFTDYDDDSPQNYQHCIIKEEVMLSSDLEYSDDESESKSNDHEKRSNNGDLMVDGNPCENRKTLSADLIKLPTLKKDDINLGLIIAKFGKANCTKCRKQSKAVARQTRCKLCSRVYLYKCSICLDSTFKTFSDMCRHLKFKHMTIRELYPCSTCKISFKRREALNQHLKCKHVPLQELYTCSTCKKSFNRRNRLNEHIKVCGLTPKFKCEFCSYKARYKCNLANHVKNKHKPVNLSCDRCGKKYTHERSMRRHMKLYCGKNKSLECEHCVFEAYRKDQIIGHLKLKHPEIYPDSV